VSEVTLYSRDMRQCVSLFASNLGRTGPPRARRGKKKPNTVEALVLERCCPQSLERVQKVRYRRAVPNTVSLKWRVGSYILRVPQVPRTCLELL